MRRKVRKEGKWEGGRGRGQDEVSRRKGTKTLSDFL